MCKSQIDKIRKKRRVHLDISKVKPVTRDHCDDDQPLMKEHLH